MRLVLKGDDIIRIRVCPFFINHFTRNQDHYSCFSPFYYAIKSLGTEYVCKRIHLLMVVLKLTIVIKYRPLEVVSRCIARHNFKCVKIKKK